MGRIGDKINEIQKFLEELESSLPDDFEQYKADFKIRAICERYFEKIIEAIVDLAFLIIKENDFETPEDDKKAFDILKNNNLISEELCIQLREAKGMRNIIAHEYGRVDDELVYEAVTEQIINDAAEFINAIKPHIQ